MDNQAVDKDMDLPLMANIEEIRVCHYMMQLLFDFDEDTVIGEVLLFCQSTIQNNKELKERGESTFEMILDHRHIDFVLFLTEEAWSHGGLRARELGQTP